MSACQQAAQSRVYHADWKEAGYVRTPRVCVSRSIFPLLDNRDRAIFGRGSAAEPDIMVEQLRTDEAIAEADTLVLTIPNQLGVDYCTQVTEGILKHVAPALGWR